MPRTDSSLPGVTIQENDSTGLITLGQCSGSPASLATAASKFAIGCILTDTTAGKAYQNVGTVASPSWNSIGDSAVSEITLAQGSIIIGNSSGVGAALDGKTSGQILVGDGTTMASVAVSGDATLSSAGALTIAAGAVSASKVADAAGVAAANGFVKKYAIAVYDFAVSGGTAGAITLPTASIPNKAVVMVDSYDVLTTLTSATSAATVKLGLATDGDLTTAIAINAGSSPWNSGSYSRIAGALATPLTKKATAARAVVLTIGVENVTAGKVVFFLSYWISQ